MPHLHPIRDVNKKRIDYVDVVGNDIYRLLITADRSVYIQGQVPWADEETTDIAALVPDIKAQSVAVGGEIWAVLCCDGSVVACGGSFSGNEVVIIAAKGVAKSIAVMRYTVLVNTGVALLTYSSRNVHSSIDLCGRRAICVSTYEPGYLVLLDDGVLYCTFAPRNLGITVTSPIPGLHIVSGFLRGPMIHMETSLDEIICMYHDGSMTYGWADQNHDGMYPVLAMLPAFNNICDEQVVHIHISRDLVWLLTTENKAFYISKLPWLDLDNAGIARFKSVPNTFPSPISHFRATWNEIYLFVSDENHPAPHTRLTKCAGPDDLQHVCEMFHVPWAGQQVLVDPFGGLPYGFVAGDIVRHYTMLMQVVGTIRDNLVLQKLEKVDRYMVALSSTGLIQLVGDADKIIEVDCGAKYQIHVRDEVLGMVCDFKHGDVIESTKKCAVVLGVRYNCLWVSIGGKTYVCRYTTRDALHRYWKLKTRKNGNTVTPVEDVDGNMMLVEAVTLEGIEPGAVVHDRDMGLGRFIGQSGMGWVVQFVSDCGRARVIDDQWTLRIGRSVKLSSARLTSAWDQIINIYPGPGCLIPDTWFTVPEGIAVCRGHCKDRVVYETESSIIHGISLRYCDEKVVNIVAEYGDACVCPRNMTTADGDKISLNINIGDFGKFKAIPMDVVSIGERIGEVMGQANGTLFVRFIGSAVVEPFDDSVDFDTIYRRVNVPTRKTFGDDLSGWIDLEHFRGSHTRPYDLISHKGRRLIIQALIKPHSFVVADYETLEFSRFDVPLGKTLRRIKSLLFD